MKEKQACMMNLPKQERPRERLLYEGVEALSNQELLAILLRTGTVNDSVIQLSQRLMQSFDGLRMLQHATVEELIAVKGIGLAKAVQILAAFELGRRIHRQHSGEKYTIRTPEDGANYVMEELRFLTQEHFVCIYLNMKNQVIHRKTVFIGSLNASIVHPREVFKEGLKRSAASIICFHNHPSGDPAPSHEDIEVTKRLVECGQLLGMEVLDHIIIGDKRYISLKEKGYV